MPQLTQDDLKEFNEYLDQLHCDTFGHEFQDGEVGHDELGYFVTVNCQHCKVAGKLYI